MLNNQEYIFFQVEKIQEKMIAIMYLNQPKTRNTMNWAFWEELPLVVNQLEEDPEVNVIIVAAKGKSFSVGLDLVEFNHKFKDIIQGDVGEKREELRQLIIKMQLGFRKIIQSRKVYIAAVHKHCIGGGLDLICACDIRIASKSVSVSLRETKVGIVADMCSLNRLSSIIGIGKTRYMAFTGRDFSAEECYQMGLFEIICDKDEELIPNAIEIASEIASNPPIVISGIKNVLNYMENHNTLEGMDYVALWN